MTPATPADPVRGRAQAAVTGGAGGDASNRVLIVGGGIAGLSLACALRAAEIPVTVFERDSELKEVGAGLQVWVSGHDALVRLGLADAVAERGLFVDAHEVRSWRGGALMTLPVGQFASRHGRLQPFIVQRPHLLGTLARAAGDVVELKSEFVGLEQDEGGVTARFADGREERGAVLVGADGIDSAVRTRVFGVGTTPTQAGYQWSRGVGPPLAGAKLPEERRFSLTLGPGIRFGASPPGGPWTDWWAAGSLGLPTGDSGPAVCERLLKLYADFPPPTCDLIRASDPASIGVTEIRYLKPLDRWARGRCVLIGDAAHAMTPDVGRGASEALVDGVVLADCLGARADDGRGVASALRAFEGRRQQRLADFQREAPKLGRLFGWSNPTACLVRDQLMKRVAIRRLSREWEAEFAAGVTVSGF